MRTTFPLALLVCLLGASPALAQVESGEIVGRVSDTTGAVLPGATIVLEGPALIQPQTAVTAATGAYRFPKLPIGVYKVTVQLPGFTTYVRTGVRIETGFVAEINAQLELTSVAETITVTGETPIVDIATTKTGATFSREALDALPSARDPWVILEQTPGMVMDRQNVGGNQSGQQSSFLAHGSDLNQQWNVNGATVTDMAANSSPGYYDFDSFEEIQISTGGGDASQEAAGVAINLVTKSGGNTFRGASKFVFVNDALQSDNITDELRAQNAGSGNPIKDIKEYGFDVGGPIMRDKAWFWGAYSGNDIIVSQIGFLKPGCTDPNDINCLQDDETNLDSINAKLDYQWSTGQKSGFYWKKGAKFRNARDAGPLEPLETTVVQNSPGPGDFQGSHQWIVSDRLAIDGKFTYSDSSFDLDFQSDDLAAVQPSLDLVTGLEGRSPTTATYNVRPTYETRADGNYFLPGLWKADHSTKFGVRYRSTPFSTLTITGGGAIARLRNGVPSEAEMRRDGYTPRDLWEFSTYFHDTIRAGRWTWNLGVRWDYHDDEANPAQVPANAVLPDLLPAIDFGGADSGATFSNVSPRFGVSYDVAGTGRTVLKFNANRYYGLGIFTAGTISPTGQTTLRYPWNDRNGDLFVQREELDLTRILNNSTNYDPRNPNSVVSPASVDRNLQNDITDELIGAFDHELFGGFAVGVSYIWRQYHNDQWDPLKRLGLSSADFIPRTLTLPCGNSSCDQPSYTVTYYELPFQRPAETLLTNWERVRKYQGVELTARKRFSNRWMMMGAVTWNDTRLYYNGPDGGFQDPTDVAQYDGQQAGTLNVRWVAKLSGMYQLPWGFSTGAFLNMRQGFPFYRELRTPSRAGGLGTADVDVYPFASERYPNMTLVDWRIDKRIGLPGNTRLDLVATVFNVANANTVQDRFRRQEASNANNVQEILAPRAINLQARFIF